MSPKTKNSLRVFWQATQRGCALAIAILFLFFAIMSIITAAEGKNEQGMTFSSMMTLTAFALVISYAKEIFRVRSIPAPAQWLINFFIIGIGFFLVVLRSGMIAPSGDAFYVVGLLLYVVSYLIVFGLSLLIRMILKKKGLLPVSPTEETEEYVSRFD